MSATWRGPDHRLSDVVKTSAQLLLLAPKERPPGSIVLSNFDASARVLVDGIDRTADARGGGRIDGVDVGVHEVTLEGPDKITLVTPVVVMSGAEATVDATLEPVPVPGALLVAGGVSAVVVGAAATAAVLYFIGRGDVNVSAAVPVASINNVEALRGIGK